jgi:glucose/arabinose dehydrogenase
VRRVTRPSIAAWLRALPTAILVATLALGAAPSAPADAAVVDGQLVVTSVLGGLSSPLGVVNAGDGSGRLFIVQQGGTVRVVQGNKLQAGTFLDISAKVNAGGERGLLGLAFHPDFETNRRLFVYYTRGDGDITVSRLIANAGGTSAPSSSELVLFRVEHSSRSNHNGGALAFGPDGYLYIGVGDGGGGGDPDDNGQDPSTRLGKILRIDVDGSNAPGGAYGYPADNPYVGKPGDDAVFAIGLRNPWRISFDRSTDDFWIADVGQGSYEEVDRDPAPPTPGRNYGWNVMEGKHCYGGGTCDQAGLALPVAEYTHAAGNCSVTGGYAYRGPSQRQLQGLYVFADYCSGRIWTMPVGGDPSITETPTCSSRPSARAKRANSTSSARAARSTGCSSPSSRTSPQAPSSMTSTGSSTRG